MVYKFEGFLSNNGLADLPRGWRSPTMSMVKAHSQSICQDMHPWGMLYFSGGKISGPDYGCGVTSEQDMNLKTNILGTNAPYNNSSVSVQSGNNLYR